MSVSAAAAPSAGPRLSGVSSWPLPQRHGGTRHAVLEALIGVVKAGLFTDSRRMRSDCARVLVTACSVPPLPHVPRPFEQRSYVLRPLFGQSSPVASVGLDGFIVSTQTGRARGRDRGSDPQLKKTPLEVPPTRECQRWAVRMRRSVRRPRRATDQAPRPTVRRGFSTTRPTDGRFSK